MLLQGQPAVRARCIRAVRDLSTPRRPAATATATAVGVSPGAPLTCRVVVPVGTGAGRSARLSSAVRPADATFAHMRGSRGVYLAMTRKLSAEAVAEMAAKDRIGKAGQAARAAQGNRYIQRIV